MIEDDDLRVIYDDAATIAVVGASRDESKPGHRIPAYLKSQGYRIIPVNPTEGDIFGERTYSRLEEIDVPVDVVEVFRPAEEAPGIARSAAAIGAGVLWLQTGIYSEEAEKIASDAGLTVIMDRCMGSAHGELGLGPGP